MLSTTTLSVRLLDPARRLPLVVETLEPVPDPSGWVVANKTDLLDLLAEHGAILLRGFGIDATETFSAAIAGLREESLSYKYRSTPRESLGKDVYTASEYPAKYAIPMHCENAYQADWPTKLFFACAQPSESGGQTPLADMRGVTRRLSPECREAFETRGVCYVRTYHEGVDLSWQNVFQTESRDEVAALCSRMGIEHEWIDDDLLRTRQTAQGYARHHTTGEKIFFNQAHLFHVTSLGQDAADSLIETFGLDELPRHARFGDGSEIPPAMLAEVRAAFEAEKVFFDWQRGDCVLIDNMQVAHGREPFTGPRQILASLCDPYSKVARAGPNADVRETLASVA